MERDAPPAYYYPPTIDGSRPGIYFVNTYDLPTRLLPKLAEHHLPRGGARATTSRSRSRWSTRRCRRSGASAAASLGAAYAEGWGLYSERLADEMGLYRSDAERFGMLEAQAWRAVRLIVDTGIHALRTGPGLGDRPAASTRPASRRPTRRSRPTATSSGRARP